MALGISSLKGKKSNDDNSSPSASENGHEMQQFGGNNYFKPGDTEAQTTGRRTDRPMRRIDKPRTTSISGNIVGSTDPTEADISVGQQMELEAGNAIQYRTCSWQKV